MAAMEVNLNLLLQLQAIGFPFARAARALHSTRNVSIEEAVNWIIDHENDPSIDQAPLVNLDIDIETSSSFVLSEEMRKKTQKLMESVYKNQTQEDSHHREETRRNMELATKEKISKEKTLRKVEQDKAERRIKGELLDERPEPLKCPSTVDKHLRGSLPSTMSSKKDECMRACLKALKRNYKLNTILHVKKDDIYKARRAFQTLLIYVGNVTKHPENEKFRKIRLANPIFQERVGSLKGGIEFLEVCGFERREREFLYLPPHKVDVNSLKSAGILLNSAISNPFFGVLSP